MPAVWIFNLIFSDFKHSEGWRIVSSSPREAIGVDYTVEDLVGGDSDSGGWAILKNQQLVFCYA